MEKLVELEIYPYHDVPVPFIVNKAIICLLAETFITYHELSRFEEATDGQRWKSCAI